MDNLTLTDGPNMAPSVEASTPESADRSIADLARDCTSVFHQLLSLESLKGNEWSENRLADFNLWTDGVGATAKPGASLDSRLKGRADDLQLVKNLLAMLQDFLIGYIRCAKSGNGTEEAVRNVDSAIKNLEMIGVAIRWTGKASRTRRTERTFDPSEHRNFRRHLECMILLHPSEDGRNPDDLDFSKLNHVQNRLIEANLRRRHSFSVAQKRSMRSEASYMEQPPHLNRIFSNPSTQGETQMQRRNEFGNPTRMSSLKAREHLAPTITGFSTASTAEGTLQYTPVSRHLPEAVKSQITFISGATDFPKPPKTPPGSLICKCPCCCQSLPIDEVLDPKKWRQHLIEDLRPYTCIAIDCPKPAVIFSTRKEWETHIRRDHKPQWQCPLCDERDLIFTEMEGIVIHLQTDHQQEIREGSLSTILS
ncbi:uncharacterized protein BCR38DRAFT_202302 [Pseudomassariella vexata]|uniref:C2H2-type domain-containing protein n=1 Tax=Pseudomassariella vexata TaxID=1141098 RepID=A0A1Y2DXH4_9PEZI|nr:uncharacterized protein BCR38DRAFT_202302 [Pseudomassariella vexata]ORY63909.1 hypothetical protein BCR38DRAFT_202302 [Pseudomassariella vexata]